MSSWKSSGSLTKRSWRVIKANKYLLLIPIFSAFTAAPVFLAFLAAGGLVLGVDEQTLEQAAAQDGAIEFDGSPLGWVLVALGVYLATLVATIWTGALVHCANEELHDRESSIGAGLSKSMSRLPALVSWALIQTLVGWILSALRGNSNQAGAGGVARAAGAGLLSAMWSIATFFVMPFIVLRDTGSIKAIKNSFALIRQTWGKQVMGNFRIGGLVALVAVLPSVLALVGGGFLLSQGNSLGIPLMVIGGVVLIFAMVLVSAMKAIFGVALFTYATEGTGLGPFDEATLAQSVKVRGEPAAV